MALKSQTKRLLVKAMRAGRKHGPTLRAAGRTLTAASAFLPILRKPARLFGRLLYLGGAGSELLSAIRGKGKKRKVASGRGGGRKSSLMGRAFRAARGGRSAPPSAPTGAGPSEPSASPTTGGGLSAAERQHLEKQFGKQGAAEIERMLGQQNAAPAPTQPRNIPAATPPVQAPAPRQVPTATPPAEPVPAAAPQPVFMPSAERRTTPPAPRTLPPASMPETSGQSRQLPAMPSGGPGTGRRRVPWTGWKSQLRDRGGRWTGEQLEGGEKGEGGGGGGEDLGQQLDKFGDVLDQFDDVVKKLSDTADKLSDTTDKFSAAVDRMQSSSQAPPGGAPKLDSAKGFGQELSEGAEGEAAGAEAIPIIA